eukprot:24106-Chlamydomonas_euryale.AAC.8
MAVASMPVCAPSALLSPPHPLMLPTPCPCGTVDERPAAAAAAVAAAAAGLACRLRSAARVSLQTSFTPFLSAVAPGSACAVVGDAHGVLKGAPL